MIKANAVPVKQIFMSMEDILKAVDDWLHTNYPEYDDLDAKFAVHLFDKPATHAIVKLYKKDDIE